MECKEVYRFICDNLDQTVDSPECRAIRKHIAECADCEAYLNSLKQVVVLYKRTPSPSVPVSVHRRLMHILTRYTHPPHAARRSGTHSGTSRRRKSP